MRPSDHCGFDLWRERHINGRVHRHALWTHERTLVTDSYSHEIWTLVQIRRRATRLGIWWTWTVILRRDRERLMDAGIEGHVWQWKWVLGRFK